MNRDKQLAELLERFVAVDPAEHRNVARMRRLLEGGGDPFSRDYFVPGHFTASAFILSPDERSLLLIHHAKLHRWLQPGGHIEPGDADVIAAARREVREEVGLERVELMWPGIFDADVHPIPARGDEPGHEHFDVRFLFRAMTWEAKAASDARDHRWVALAELTVELTDASVMRAVGRLARGSKGGNTGA